MSTEDMDGMAQASGLVLAFGGIMLGLIILSEPLDRLLTIALTWMATG